MLTRDEVIDLIATPKLPEKGSELIFHQNIIENVYSLKSAVDDTTTFKVDLTQHKQISLKLSCHYRDGSNIGLIRVDYNGPKHRNPQVISSNVPKILHDYSGFVIKPRESHVHIYVEGEDLDWAIPLMDFSKLSEEERDGISVAQIDINNHTEKVDAVRSFANTINIQTEISTDGGLIFN